MMVLRPARLDDLPALFALSQRTGFGLTTLPRDEALLRGRIRASLRAFARSREDSARGDSYLFVLEDCATGRPVGTSGIVSKVGGFEPFYSYRLEREERHSATLQLRKELRTLHLTAEHNGPCEIGSLFLAPEARHGVNGRLLSLGRFSFMAECPEAFDPVVIAELRGQVNESGSSPFWEALGRHFFEVDFPTADTLSLTDKRFIADLMPSHPIYICLLPPAAQAVIGRVHRDSAPALHLLEQEGFRHNDLVDIFEAGPVVSCPRDEIRTVRESQCVELVEIGEKNNPDPTTPPFLVARRRGGFRACVAPVSRVDSEAVHLPEWAARALGVDTGAALRVSALRPLRRSPSARPSRHPPQRKAGAA